MKGREPMTAAQQVFELMCRFHHLRLPERIGMLPRAEHIVLEMLLSDETKGGTTLNAACMARRMHISAPAVSRTMRRLRERGYIIADPDPAAFSARRLLPLAAAGWRVTAARWMR